MRLVLASEMPIEAAVGEAGLAHDLLDGDAGIALAVEEPPGAFEDFPPCVALDVRDEALVKACVDEVRSRAGRIDVLINNAGVNLVGAVEETSVSAAASSSLSAAASASATQRLLPPALSM
jgi:NAD(P)-dependent dehydrogenase (short-subunit alcohol dehydrogenase family)